MFSDCGWRSEHEQEGVELTSKAPVRMTKRKKVESVALTLFQSNRRIAVSNLPNSINSSTAPGLGWTDDK
jgi:hypothetical protein